MMLDQLLNITIREGCFQPSRVKPLRSHIKRYAGWLGTEPATCPPALYHLPKDRRDALINDATLRNYHLLPTVRGDLLSKLGRLDEARQEFERAAALTRNTRERQLLLARARA